jgi:hypothetical protein
MAKAKKGSKNVDPQVQEPNGQPIEVVHDLDVPQHTAKQDKKDAKHSTFKSILSTKYFPLVAVLIGFAFIGSYWVLFSKAAAVNGLTGNYYNNSITLSGTPVKRIDSTVNFNWAGNAPMSNIGVNTFSVRWTGQVKPSQTGVYKFVTVSDDGVRVWVNGQLLIDNWTQHAPTTNTGSITLTANSYYDIKVEYFENTGGATIQLKWTRPDGTTEVIPSSALFSEAQQPSAPQSVTTRPGDKAVTMTWKAPANLGSSAITGYRVTRITGDSVAPNPWTTVLPATASSEVFTYLQNGTTYQFSVAAINSAGEGPATVVSGTPQAGAVVTPPTGTSIVSVTSPFTVTSNPYNQDTEYRVTSSLRQSGAANPLPFDMPSRATLAASPKKAVAHYFPQFPISIDNADPSNDYYARNWLTAGGEGGAHVAYGGYLRDRPLTRAPITGDWQLADATTEAKWARDAGLDGFLVDTLGWTTTSGNYQRGRKIFDGAKNLGDSTFKVAYMVDTDIVSGTDYATAAARIADAYNSGAYMMVNGKLVVSAYRPEGNSTPSFWQNIDTTLKNTYKLPGMVFIPCYSSNWNAHTTFDAITYAMGVWTIGNAPGANSSYWKTSANSVGKPFMQPIAFGDSRPRSGIFDEQQGLLTLRDQWLTAIANNVDWVQYRTWSDFSEGAQMIPSRNHGYSYLDVSAYYLAKWKTGTYPTIKRDALYVSHRISTWDNHNTQVSQTKWQTPRSASTQPGQNIVDVMSFLTAPGNVTVKVGSNTYTYAAPAGVFNKSFPLANGTVSATLSR